MTRIAVSLALLTGLAACLAAQDAPSGRFTGRGAVLTLSEGRYSFEFQGRTMVTGTMRLEAGRLELTDDGGPGICNQGTGRYTWRESGDTLRFTLVEDPCDGRKTGIPNPVWVRLREGLALTHATLIDGTGAPPRPGQTVIIRDGKIAAIVPDGSPLPGDVTVRDVAGQFVLPGLVDAHVHLATSPSGADARSRVERRLRNAVLGGVVAVRDMAGDARALADLARAAAAGDIPSPEIRYAAVIAGPEFFDDPRVRSSSVGLAPGTAPWARALWASSDVRQIVAEAKGTGAAAIKLYADLDGTLAAKITREAHRQGLLVWSHLVLVPARPSEVLAAGVDAVSHAAFALWEASPLRDYRNRGQIDFSVSADHPAIQRLFDEMKRRNQIFDPTLFVYRADSAAADTSLAKRREGRAAEVVRVARAAGVRIAAGTDGMGTEADGALPNLHTELELLVERGGLTAMEAIVAGTRTSAEAAGLVATHGTLAVGKAADLLVLRADPLADIRNTRQISFVVRQGKILNR